MKITITGSLGNVGKPLTALLIAAGHEVVVVSGSLSRADQIQELGAKAAIGSVSDAGFLRSAFEGSDAVFAMTPPGLGGSNIIEHTKSAGKAFATAINKAGIKKVVMLSSIGADLSSGNGPIAALYHIEKEYEQLENVSVLFLRAGYFYTNFFNDIPLIKNMGIIGSNYASHSVIPLVHPIDIASAAADALQQEFTENEIRYIVSDVRSGEDIAAVFGTALNKPDLSWVEFTDEQAFQGMLQAGLPVEMAELYREMGEGLRSGAIQAHFREVGSPAKGLIKLEEFAKEFSSVYDM